MERMDETVDLPVAIEPVSPMINILALKREERAEMSSKKLKLRMRGDKISLGSALSTSLCTSPS